MTIYEAKMSFRKVRDITAPILDSPEVVHAYMTDAFDPDPSVEWFFVILLNRKNRALGRVAITKGTATSSLVHPREVFRPALLANAPALIAVHNHPSGDPAPSSADIRATRLLREAASVLQMDLLDHIICGQADCDPVGNGWYSFAEAGLL
jgi:DNA repair protein RadC